MLSYEQFEYYMNKIKAHYAWIDQLWCMFEPCSEDAMLGIDTSIKLLSELMDDTTGWIEWYIYETEWGRRKDMTNAFAYEADNFEGLYKFLEIKHSNKGVK